MSFSGSCGGGGWEDSGADSGGNVCDNGDGIDNYHEHHHGTDNHHEHHHHNHHCERDDFNGFDFSATNYNLWNDNRNEPKKSKGNEEKPQLTFKETKRCCAIL
jgi:hypothetical protein